MIQLEDTESVVRDHLEQHAHLPDDSDKDQHSTAYYPKSEAVAMKTQHSISDINIKIVDFGVGM